MVALLTYAFPPHSTVAEIEAWEGRGEGVVAWVVRAVTLNRFTEKEIGLRRTPQKKKDIDVYRFILARK